MIGYFLIVACYHIIISFYKTFTHVNNTYILSVILFRNTFNSVTYHFFIYGKLKKYIFWWGRKITLFERIWLVHTVTNIIKGKKKPFIKIFSIFIYINIQGNFYDIFYFVTIFVIPSIFGKISRKSFVVWYQHLENTLFFFFMKSSLSDSCFFFLLRIFFVAGDSASSIMHISLNLPPNFLLSMIRKFDL